jgi:hypothetical protein
MTFVAISGGAKLGANRAAPEARAGRNREARGCTASSSSNEPRGGPALLPGALPERAHFISRIFVLRKYLTELRSKIEACQKYL